MRSFAAGLWCLWVGSLFACSGGSSGQGAGGTSAGGAAAAGGSSSASAGSGGASTASAAGGGNVAGASAEGNDVMGPLDTTSGAGAPGGMASDVRVDAGEPPLTQAVCPPGPFAANPVPGGAAPEVVCSGMTFTEGPVWFEERNTLFFSDFQLNNPALGRIMSFTPGGQCEPFIATAGTNGLVIAPDGNLLGARHSDQTLTVFDLETQQPTVLVADNAGASFNSPNDIAVRSDGNMYFTDPTFLLGNRDSELPARAYRRDPSGALSVIDQTGNTNGITLSPDETRLYLSHLGGQSNIIVFDVDAAGAVTNPQPFIGVGSDGMVVDCAGNLYITQGGVRVYDPDGELITTIAAPGAANVAFGGPERRTLYITAEDELLAVELAIPGLPY